MIKRDSVNEPSFQQIKQLLVPELEWVENILRAQFESEVTWISEAALSLITGGGKRIRPLVVLLCAKALGYEGPDHCRLAAIVELIHTATLLHDDVIDNASFRRNTRTVNALHGNKAAILIGDFLYSKSFLLMLTLNRLDVLKILAGASNVIAEGEILQLLQERHLEVSQALYLRVITKKTAKLFEAAAELPCLLLNKSKGLALSEYRCALKSYGHNLGLLFQIVDDLMDYQPLMGTTGKSAHADLLSGKPTLPLIYLLTHSTDEALVKLAQDAIQGKWGDSKESSIQRLEAGLKSSGALDYTWSIARQYAEAAQMALESLPNSKYKAALHALVELALLRRE